MQHLPRRRGRGRTHASLVLALVLHAVPPKGGEEGGGGRGGMRRGAASEPARGADRVPSLPGEGASAALRAYYFLKTNDLLVSISESPLVYAQK